MSRFDRSLIVLLAVAIAAGSVSVELCSVLGDEHDDIDSLRHSHGGYEHHHHHHHHHDGGVDGEEHDDDHGGFDHVPNDLKSVWTAPRSKLIDAPPVPPMLVLAPDAAPGVVPGEAGVGCGLPPPRAGPDPTRQLRQIRTIVLLV